MAQDTRKDPRAKVLSMTVRYKSATVDEFIQHHAHDVSRGGIYIKTPSPFPPGTLLKFEIRIQDEQSVLAGVGRVVWKREADQATPESPAGMGVKFIKIDDKSKGIIARLVDAQGGGISAYDRGHPGGAEAEAAKAPAADKAADKAGDKAGDKAKRASTMLGLGAIGAAEVLKAAEAAKAEAASEPEKSGDAGGFFPKSSTDEADQRPPEERTVMKQAAELLQQALSEAGGSLGELDALPAADKAPEPEKLAAKSSEPTKAEAKPAADKPLEAKPVEAKPAAKPAADKPAAAATTKVAAPAKPVAKTEPAKSAAEKPAPVSARAEPEEEPSSSGKLVLGLAIAAVVAGGAYFFLAGGDAKPPAGTPTVTASAKPSAVPSSEPSAAPTAEPTAEPTAKPTAEPPPPPATTQKPPPPPPPATTQKPPPPPPPATTQQPPPPPPPPPATTQKPPPPPPPSDDIYN